MFGLIMKLAKFIITIILKVYKPKWLLRLDDWCEEKLGIDIIKEDKKFHELYPIVANRIKKLECPIAAGMGLGGFGGFGGPWP